MDDLAELAELVKTRNTVAEEIAAIVGRPALIGHVGEYIAAKVFGIALEESAVSRGIDGRLAAGPLAGKSVNIKWYAKHEGLLDIRPDALPDYYLVLAGAKAGATSSRGSVRPWLIKFVFLFNAEALLAKLKQRGVKIGVATSVGRAAWDEAELYPTQRNTDLMLTDAQREMLALFGGGSVQGACTAEEPDVGTGSATWERIRESVAAGDRLLTPGRGIPPANQRPFWIRRVGSDFLTIEVGKAGFSAKVPALAFEAVTEQLRAHIGTLRIAALHANEPLPGSVDEVVRRAVGWNLASGNYVAAILEHAGLVEYVMKGGQKHIRLREE